jgi:hypothetical protein
VNYGLRVPLGAHMLPGRIYTILLFGLFYQNEVANKLDKIHNGRVCCYEKTQKLFIKLNF